MYLENERMNENPTVYTQYIYAHFLTGIIVLGLFALTTKHFRIGHFGGGEFGKGADLRDAAQMDTPCGFSSGNKSTTANRRGCNTGKHHGDAKMYENKKSRLQASILCGRA
jgi:hypothetical protein